MKQATILIVYAIAILVTYLQHSNAASVFVIGDSQIGSQHSVGYADFFKNNVNYCGENLNIKSLGMAAHSGSGFDDWTALYSSAKKNIHGNLCNENDYRIYSFGVKNQGVCSEGRRGVDLVLRNRPEVVVANFHGAHKFDTQAELDQQIKDFADAISPTASCIIMTSSPLFREYDILSSEIIARERRAFYLDRYTKADLEKDIVELKLEGLPSDYLNALIDRLRTIFETYVTGDFDQMIKEDKAQVLRQRSADRIEQAVKTDGRCHIVNGFNQETFEKLALDYRNYNIEEAYVTDPNYGASGDRFHMSAEGSLNFFKLNKDRICSVFKRAKQSLPPQYNY